MKKLFTFLFVFTFVQVGFGQLSGIYSVGTNTVAGESGNYENLSAAVIAINTVGISGPCTFYFTDNTTYVDTAVSLGCSGTSATNTITFKPYTGVTCTIDFTSIIGKSIDGLWVIGSTNFSTSTLVPTNYVIIDGSNTIGGTSKDLTIQNPSNTAQRSVFRIFGNNDNITIKNCIIINRSTSGSSTAPINVTNYFNVSNFTPDNLTIQNNTLTSIAANGSLGITLSNSGNPTVGITGLVIRENIISNRGTRAIMCNYVNDANIFGNTISSDNQQAGTAYASIWLSTGTANGGTFNIYNNKLIQLRTMNTTDGVGFGIVGIDNQLGVNKIVNIYNNFIAGFTTVATTSNAKIYGIRHTAASISNIYHNTIYIPEMVNMTTFGTSKIAGIAFATHATTEASPTGTMNLLNNIIISDETSMKTWGIRRVGTGGTFTSNFNNIYYNATNTLGYVGFDNTSDQQTLADWIVNTVYDDNSKSINMNFVSATDLHLSGTSLGDVNLIGTPLAAPFNVDIDGEGRHSLYPYIGADENDFPLPVELTSFTASVIGSRVKLSWQTATEINNYGFEVERALSSTTSLQVWENIGFVSGNGNSNSQKSYSFTDESISLGKYAYRLKQIDNDGTFEFSNAIEVDLGIPTEFSLSQNYPNPFNPTTKIQYSLPIDAQVTLQIYSITGELLESLVSSYQTSGSYTIDFDGSNFASGTYIYRLVANDFVQTKKMTLVK